MGLTPSAFPRTRRSWSLQGQGVSSGGMTSVSSASGRAIPRQPPTDQTELVPPGCDVIPEGRLGIHPMREVPLLEGLRCNDIFGRFEQGSLESLRRPASKDVLAGVSPVDDVADRPSEHGTRLSAHTDNLGGSRRSEVIINYGTDPFRLSAAKISFPSFVEVTTWGSFFPMKPPRLVGTENIKIEGNDFLMEFSPAGGVFPTDLRFAGDSRPLVQRGDWGIEWVEKGLPYHPANAVKPRTAQLAESLVVNFDGVPFVRTDGARHPDLKISLEYEIFRDGTGFCTFFLQGESLEGVALDRLSLRLGFTPASSWDTDWAYWQFPPAIDGSTIQSVLARFGRKIPVSEPRDFPGEITPFVGFDSGDSWRRTHHIEFFLEGSGGVSNTRGEVSTQVREESGKPGVTWNLQDRLWRRKPGRAIIYRNIFGFCLTRSPRTLPRPPLRIYHYFDNFRPYPSETDVADIRQAGADTLILHEAWRRDVRNGEFPADPEALRSTLDACRRQGIRCGFYFRGNEDAIRDRHAEILAPYLRKNHDGLYLDYGTPFMYLSHEEFSPDGRIRFREYHRVMRRLRALVGEEGFLLSHSGSFFCALAHASLDGYYGGEQEQGKLLASREHHAYFAGLAVAPAYWWTAAFPIYRSQEAVALMAATLHAPVVNLGTQFPWSSLHHPPTPGTNTFARGLWMLWSLMDGRGPLQVRDTHRAPETFSGTPEIVAPAALWDREGHGIITASNLSDKPVATALTLHEKELTGTGEKFLIPLRWKTDRAEAGAPEPFNRGIMPEFPLAPHEVAGWLVTDNPSAWKKPLEERCRPAIWASATAEWNAFVNEQRALRREAPPWKECHLQVSLPCWPNTYEDSIWEDLFDNDLALDAVDSDGKSHSLGFLDRHGLHATPGQPSERLTGGGRSPWISLPAALQQMPGSFQPTHIRLAARKNGMPFYLFARIHLSPEPEEMPKTRTLEFCVDVDGDWSALTFGYRR